MNYIKVHVLTLWKFSFYFSVYLEVYIVELYLLCSIKNAITEYIQMDKHVTTE